MCTDDCITRYAREVHDLRVLLVILMHIRAEYFMKMGDENGWPVTDFEELAADWDDLASSLPKRQWLTGVRAFDHVSNLDIATEDIIPDSKALLNRLYRGYSAMGCTNYSPPRMMAPRYLKNGLEHIKKEFECNTVAAKARNQNARCDKGGEMAPSQHDSAVESTVQRSI